MDRKQLIQFISEQYNADAEHPWLKYPDYIVFRHKNNQKWFAVIMDIPRSKLGSDGDEPIDILNVKCDHIMLGSLRSEKGFYPAYHMSKANWITIALDEDVGDSKIEYLLDRSFELTDTRKKRK